MVQRAVKGAARLLLASLLLGSASPVHVAAEEGPTFQARGAEIYSTYCAGCHGDKGDGHGPAADMLIVKPRDFTNGVFKFRSTPTGELPTNEDLYRIITNGAYGTSMPAWRLLTESERYAVIDFIQGFYSGWATEGPGAAIFIPRPPESVGSVAAVARGRELYELLDCAKCHGDRGRGDGESAGDLDPDIWGNKQRPFNFTSGPLRGGSRAEDVYRTFMTGVGGTAMPSYADIFEEVDDEYIFEGDAWNLVSYVLSLRRSGAQTVLGRKE
jgi:mono/diheme cytochrome c family protein